jgi:tripartite-type tricarboxylate transporter receptor subunit TctC
MVQKLWPFACVMALVLASRAPAGTIAPFYEGKTVRIIVGFAAGGGFDTYTRAIARHLGRHIPGSPAIVVENMTGAGSLIAANHVYKVAKPATSLAACSSGRSSDALAQSSTPAGSSMSVCR